METAVLTCAEMTAADKAARDVCGIPGMILMENAARSAAEYIIRYIAGAGGVLVAAGKGNNGGDALAVARHIRLAGFGVRVVLLRRDLGDLPRIHLNILERLDIPVCVYADAPEKARALAAEAEWIVDGLYGIGLKGALKDESAGFVKIINDAPGRVISLDLPSGLGDGFRAGYPVVEADVTLTFEAPKLCLYLPAGRRVAGRVVVLSAGFPPECLPDTPSRRLLRGEAVLKALLPRPHAADYKNSRGHLAVFAGAPGTTGAALLASEGALRAGAGLVSLYADRDVYPVLASAARSVMVNSLAELSPDAWDASACKALLAGPGWGRAASRELWLRRLMNCGLPGVMDADALHVLKGILSGGKADLSGWVLTPHPGEFAALTGVSREELLADPLPALEDFCGTYRCVLVLKGHVTIIHDGEGKILIHDGMNPALGTAGSGDVLAGVIAGLLCRGMQPAAAAVCGVELHGAAGKTARETAGFFTAGDLLPYISKEAWRDA